MFYVVCWRPLARTVWSGVARITSLPEVAIVTLLSNVAIVLVLTEVAIVTLLKVETALRVETVGVMEAKL